MKKHLLILFILILPSFSTLLRPGFFPMHDDLQTIRQLEMSNCLADLQLPCRWSAQLGNGFGYPLFNYYPPLPYLIGQVFVTLGLQFVDVVKIVGILGFVLSAFFMYFLSRQFLGHKGGLLSAVFYTYAPYHAVDFYVRGAMNEFWALVFFPLIFLAIYKVIHLKFFGAWNLVLVISVSGLMLSHNPTLMIFAPLAIIWTLFWLFYSRNLQSLIYLSISGFWALGVAAFFTLPVLFEQSYVHIETLVIGYFNYLAHFIDLNQIFMTINWGFGGSGLGPDDGLSFALGYLHWLVPVSIIGFFIFKKSLRIHLPLALLLLSFTLLALFMSHSRSSPIWAVIKPLEYLQFPWRFLTLAIFSVSLLCGSFVVFGKKLTPILLFLVILLNANYFLPLKWDSDTTDSQVFSGASWAHLITGSIYDYLPIAAPLPPPDPAVSDINILAGLGTAATVAKTSNYQEYVVETDGNPLTVELQTFYFPGWRYFVNDVEVQPLKLDPVLGLPQIQLTESENILTAKFSDTPIRQVAKYISAISILSLVAATLVVCRKNYGS